MRRLLLRTFHRGICVNCGRRKIIHGLGSCYACIRRLAAELRRKEAKP